ncbi:MAG: hypothetical protein HXX11_10090 [Desulfuromonadales bacterium]|nr:hypothetical protein [Desulfuromonadales bacterium]
MEKNVTQETAAQQSTPTAEEIAEAHAPLAQVQISPATNQNTDSQAELEEEAADQDPTPDSVIPADVVAELTAIFNATMSNPDFFTKDNRVVVLRNALKVPVSDDRSYQQCYIHAKNTLKSEAADLSFDTGVPAVIPTEEQIHALAQKNFEKKLAQKAAKKKAA